MRQIIISLFLFLNTFVFAQTSKPEMADKMRAEGKIYVVVAVVTLILIGLFTYIIITDKKVKDIEDRLK